MYCKLLAWWQKLLAHHHIEQLIFCDCDCDTSDTRHQQWPTSKHDAATQSTCLASPMLHAPHLPPKQMRHHFWAQCAPIQHRSRPNQRQQQLHTLLSATQHLPASDHDDTPASSCLVSHTLQAPQLAPKQVRWIFCAGRPSISILLTLYISDRSISTHAAFCDTAVASIRA